MSFSPAIKKYFTTQLLQWNANDNHRELPWKNETDPYKIWLSEIILQQTRAEQGRPYYEKFILHYPDVKALAAAKDDDVFRDWQGLGYYNRCRNLLAAARTIASEYDGQFPQTYEAILALKGIGPYTAAAIASFAFQLPYAVLDGNVYRVLSRYFGIDTPIDSTEGKQLFQQLVDELLDQKQPAAFNQAIMDFGASVCTPKLPDCDNCPLAKNCIAYKQEMIGLLPVKSKKLIVKERNLHYVVLLWQDEIYIQQRNQKDIWQSLYEFFLIETDADYKLSEHWVSFSQNGKEISETAFENKQMLTHQLIRSTFHLIELYSKPEKGLPGIWIRKDLLKNYPFPKTILSFLNRKKYF
jgi:A/G-specific adenine glycosylase